MTSEAPSLQFDTRHTRQHLKAGATSRLHVIYSGDPQASISWNKDGFLLATRGNASVETSEYSSTLILRNASLHDEGVYEIVAKNEWGVSRQKFEVKIIGELNFNY